VARPAAQSLLVLACAVQRLARYDPYRAAIGSSYLVPGGDWLVLPRAGRRLARPASCRMAIGSPTPVYPRTHRAGSAVAVEAL